MASIVIIKDGKADVLERMKELVFNNLPEQLRYVVRRIAKCSTPKSTQNKRIMTMKETYSENEPDFFLGRSCYVVG